MPLIFRKNVVNDQFVDVNENRLRGGAAGFRRVLKRRAEFVRIFLYISENICYTEIVLKR